MAGVPAAPWYHKNHPGVFYDWAVRSTEGSDDPQDILDEPWVGTFYLHYQFAWWRTWEIDATSLLVPNRKYFQIQLSVWDCPDTRFEPKLVQENASPAPFFDNVRAKTFHLDGQPWGGTTPGTSVQP